MTLQGYKTYIAAAITVLTAVLAYLNGEQSVFLTAEIVAGALGLAFLRRGVKTDTGAVVPPALPPSAT